MDMVDVHYHPMKHRSGVESIDMKDSDMGEYMTIEMEVIERGHEGVMLVSH
jgi:hypothetical protein